MGITEGFTDRMVEILTVDENKGTFYEGFSGHNPSSKKITPSGPCGVSDGEQLLS
jgi:hypothetical protein